MRGFGMTFDIRSGCCRNWYIDRKGAKRWVDNDELVRGITGQHNGQYLYTPAAIVKENEEK